MGNPACAALQLPLTLFLVLQLAGALLAVP
jgi:hypothetical protein